MHGPELCAITEGTVTITATRSGARSTFKAGDFFVLPRGFTHDWSQSAAVSKFYAESPVCAGVGGGPAVANGSPTGTAGSSSSGVANSAAVAAPAVIACDKMAECFGDQQGWFFCDG